jgi:hypothetical protein
MLQPELVLNVTIIPAVLLASALPESSVSLDGHSGSVHPSTHAACGTSGH